MRTELSFAQEASFQKAQLRGRGSPEAEQMMRRAGLEAGLDHDVRLAHGMLNENPKSFESLDCSSRAAFELSEGGSGLRGLPAFVSYMEDALSPREHLWSKGGRKRAELWSLLKEQWIGRVMSGREGVMGT